jgi:SAM-dependent methyltransferase
MTKQAYLFGLKRIVQNLTFLKSTIVATDSFTKKSLAHIMWNAWRTHFNSFLFLRGIDRTSGRYYIRQFLDHYAHKCTGVFLEFGDPYFRDCFIQSQITAYDIMDVVPRTDVTILADIQNCPEIPSNTYDVIVCTQVLEHIPNPFKATAELHRILKPEGQLLLSVPAAFPYHAAPKDYWRYTCDSLHLLLDPLFNQVTLHSYGNQLVVVAAYWYWMVDHLPRKVLDIVNPDSPTIICVHAVK